MHQPFDIFNPKILTLSIVVLGAVCLVLVALVFILSISYWRMKRRTPSSSFKHHLTGMLSRGDLVTTLNKLILNAEHEKVSIALIFVDIDDFNSINTSLGNKVADDLLLQLSKALTDVAYKYTKYVYHVGSDEFAIVLYDFGKDQNVVTDVANEILHVLARPANVEGYELHSSCGVGVCVYPDCATDADTLIKNASAARDNAKKIGYGSLSIYTQEMSKKSMMRTLISGDLRTALERNEFYLHYQPKVDTKTEQILGVEALLRWRHPSLGNITPDVFIPAIEDLGLIHSIGKWVIYTACKDVSKLQTIGYPNLHVAINISAHQFNKGDIATIVAEAIWETGIQPQKVELELTEAVVMSDTEKSVLMLNVLQSMGVKIAVDDFGTGYSSMNQLTKFPISTLKIDRCFIQNIDQNPANQAIVTTMLNMGKQLGFTVVAEGVETQDELNFLRNAGCDVIQGFYYSKPLALNDLIQYLQDNNMQQLSMA